MTVKTSKIKEIVACKLTGITAVPPFEMRRMVNNCAKAVHRYHIKEMKSMRCCGNCAWLGSACMKAKSPSYVCGSWEKKI